MNNKIEFSVLISIYKDDCSDELTEALESVYIQGRKPEELILVCDGPISSKLEDVVSIYAKLFDRVGIHFENLKLAKNLGLGGALRLGASLCSKEYIVRMDSDDISAKNRFYELEKFLRLNSDVDVVGTYIEEFEMYPGDLKRFRKVGLLSRDINFRAKKRNPMNHVTVCIKKSSLLNVGNYEHILWHEDYYLWMKMISCGLKLRNIPIVSVFVRVQGLSGRRLGLDYIRSELYFLKKCRELGMLNHFDSILYMFPRIWFRILPSKTVDFLYKKLRELN